MRIDATRHSSAQGARFPIGGYATKSFSAVMSETMEKYSGQVDFTSMTRQELIDWTNNQLSSGKMTFDESSTFVAMTLTGANAPGDTRYNYMQLTREAIQGALSRKDEANLKMFEFALQIMQEANVRA
jgi:hypothetical protein